MINQRINSLIVLLTLAILNSCQNSSDKKVAHSITFSGNTQGTTYTVKYHGDSVKSYHEEIDSILTTIDRSLSLWVDSSTISRFNRSRHFQFRDRYFAEMLRRSKVIHQVTYGAFNPFVGPLVDAWGFGPGGRPNADTTAIDSLHQLTRWNFTSVPNLDSASDTGLFQVNKPEGVHVDFNAIAQGYTVDELCAFLQSRHVNNYLVEVGGEIRAAGKSSKGKPWRIGVDRPKANMKQRQVMAVIPVQNRALGTSGSYRKFYEANGKRFSHTIDPISGYPVEHNLLSATVLTGNCTDADAFATAFMVMGMDSSLAFIHDHPQLNLEAFLIASADSGKYRIETTRGIEDKLELMEPQH